MGKKHSTNKKKSDFKEIDINDPRVPQSVKDKFNELGKQDEGGEAHIKGADKEFVNIQKDYHHNTYNVPIQGAELAVMLEQYKMPIEISDEQLDAIEKAQEHNDVCEKGKEMEVPYIDLREMKWNGMIIPTEILGFRIASKNIVYKEGLGSLEYLKKALLSKGLTEAQIKEIGEDGKYIKEIPK